MALISVIIPTYNRKEKLVGAIESVLQQDFSNYELIIVDDGSTDGTTQLLEQLFSEQFQIIHQENKGVSAARNLGVLNSQGKWIAFMDSDDIWHPKKLSRQITFLKNNPALSICQTQEIWIRNGKRVNSGLKHTKPQGNIYQQSLSLCVISPSSVILTRTLFDQMGGFDPELPVCEDYDLWLRITSQEQVGLLNEQLLTKYGGDEDQLSRKYQVMDRFRIFSMLKMLLRENLTANQFQATQTILLQKLKILINGARKRGKKSIPLEGLQNKMLLGKNLRNYPELFLEAKKILLQEQYWH